MEPSVGERELAQHMTNHHLGPFDDGINVRQRNVVSWGHNDSISVYSCHKTSCW